MKEISLKPNSIKNRTPLTEPTSPITLSHVRGSVYVLSKTFRDEVILVFESHALENFLEKYPDLKIPQVEIIQTISVGAGEFDAKRELRLSLDDRRFITLTHCDEIFISIWAISPLTLQCHEYLATEILAVPNRSPYLNMALTERLITKIVEIADGEQQEHILHILWRDFEAKINASRFPLVFGDNVIISGEWFNFSVRQIVNNQFVFDLC
ncbi:hypothetical protein [Cerasicoccus fimbriatus]|uniref:hypothetical protein n=1 Tax=Cerasicoccus fimbriatus TaxID=3014554 RepID=UPI0022B31206|nr:hypothetical protein [Cerasicoccus sp. TK19100]